MTARTCARCGELYDGALHGRYCSNSCKQKAYRSRKQYRNGQTSKELRTCARCGVQFEGALHGRYHSAACKQAAYRERKERKTRKLAEILACDNVDDKNHMGGALRGL